MNLAILPVAAAHVKCLDGEEKEEEEEAEEAEEEEEDRQKKQNLHTG